MKGIYSALNFAVIACCIATGAALGTTQQAIAFDGLFGQRSPGMHDWSGLYVGAQAGGTAADVDVVYNGLGLFNGLEDAGVLGGGHIGFNIQNGDAVFGVVGDFNFADLEDTGSTSIPFGRGVYNEFEINFMGSIRGKFGVALNDWILAYGTGGVAFLNADHTYGTATSEESFWGLTAGGGFDFALNDWVSAFVEYRWTGYGDESFSSVGGAPAALHDVEISMHQAQFGVSFKLDHMFGGMGY